MTLSSIAQWNVQTVDNNGNSGTLSQIVTDSDGNPHMIYVKDSKLTYSKWIGASWQSQIVATSEGGIMDCSMDIDQFDVIYISYTYRNYNVYGTALYYFSFAKLIPGQAWSISNLIGSTTLQITDNSISCYYDQNTSAVIVHIIYRYNNSLKYRFLDAIGTWHDMDVDALPNVGAYNDMEIDSQGHPHISYYDSGGGDLKYAYFNGDIWYCIVIDGLYSNVGSYTSMDIDDNDIVHISYYDMDNHQLMHATVSQ